MPLNDDRKLVWELYVPCVRNDGRPFRTRYHRVWDNKVKEISGGLTIYPPVKGVWVANDGTEFLERMIPVRIVCTRAEMEKIAKLTKKYYEQLAVLAYVVSADFIYMEDE